MRARVLELHQAGYGRNRIERELAGQISRTSISAIIKADKERAVEGGKLSEESGKLSNTRDRNSLLDVDEDKLTEDGGNGPVDRTTSIDEEDDFSNLPYPSAIGPTSSSPVIDQPTEKEKITPTSPPEVPEQMELYNNMI